MKADLGSHIEREYLAETRSRQWPGLYRIIVLHENNNLCWTDSQQLWVLEGLPLICIPAIEKYRYAMRTWRCTLDSVFQLSQRNYGAIYVQVPQPFPNYASLRTFFTNFVHRYWRPALISNWNFVLFCFAFLTIYRAGVHDAGFLLSGSCKEFSTVWNWRFRILC